ncbi:MAG TPA: outer membrane beta-barrel protein [Gemmatimonadales bacterium]|nr:outer membrane beta-barrel protein [Gemmatimonadales bacterium]
MSRRAHESSVGRIPVALGLLAALAALAVTAAPVAAQSAWRTPGAWLGAGIGAGAGAFTCDACLTSRETGPTLGLAAGVTLTPRFAVAARLDGWVRPHDGVRDHIGAIGAAAYLFPFARQGLFVSGGLGLSRARVLTHHEGTTDRTSATGLALLAGLGYDLGVTRQVSLTPALEFHTALPSALRLNGRASGVNVRPSWLEARLGLAWHLDRRW